jgi:5-carboxyvanillate decarboxylase
MNITRRSFLRTAILLSASTTVGLPEARATNVPSVATRAFKRIAIEEAFATPEMLDEWRALLANGAEDEPGFRTLYGPFLTSPATKAMRVRLTDLGKGRIDDMDRSGIAMQVLSITAPGVQVFDAVKATGLAKKTNDQLAEVVRTYPDRFAGLAALAPQDPKQAARELERAVRDLSLRGALINSHTKGEYLDEGKYRVIFETAQALDVPIYLHPTTPSPQMIQPYLAYGLEGAGWGFAAETSLHAMRLILSGLFDEFPKLKLILGHMGEGIPFWLSRIDSRFANKLWTKMDTSGRMKRLQKAPSRYFKDNFVIATSGMNWHPVLMLAHSVLGPGRMLFAVDYPYESADEAVQAMDSAPISNDDKEKIYHVNAEKLFKLRSA